MLEFLQNDTLRLMIALSIQAPLSYPIRSINSYRARYLYSLIIGTLLQILVFRHHAVVVLLFGIAIFQLINIKGTSSSGSLVTILSMVVLSFYHLYDLIWKYGQNSMDGVVLLMIMVCKYSLFAYACQDGFKWKQMKNKEIKQDSQKTGQNEQKQRKQWWIEEDVKLLQFIGYLQFLPTAVMGPPIEFMTYRNFIKKEGAFSWQLPSRKTAILNNFKEMAICLGLFVMSQTIVKPSILKQKQFYQNNSLYIFLYTVVCLTLVRFKYYSAWRIGMTSVHASGVSFNPVDKSYTAIEHCKPLIIETTPHVRQKIGNWNIMVQDWLRKCVYERVPFKNRFLRQLSVFAVSAFWHGFYTGFYFSFFLWFAQLYLQMQIFKLGGKQGSRLHKFYKSLGPLKIGIVILSCCIFSHNATFFYLLQVDLCYLLMKRVYFIPQIAIILGVVVFSIIPKKSRHAKQINGNQKSS